MTMSEALARAKQNVGGNVGLARLIGVTSQAVSQWRRVPAERVLDVERVTGVARHDLRPDLYPPQTGRRAS
jgi:DNA-binding transcriptional regulator YdaS (Cro superfamily)